MTKRQITIKGASTHNLKNLDLALTKQEISVFVGVSGSGKTSLAFDTIAAEAQRQLNDTYPSFVRNRLPHYGKPEVVSIKQLSPVVVVNQKQLGENSRSTVGTATDINPTLRLLFSRFGQPFSGFSDSFSFNSPAGMCPACEGLGVQQEFDLSQLLDESKSLNEGAICFSTFEPGSYRWKRYVDSGLFDNDKPLSQFTASERNLLLYSEPVKPPAPLEGWYASSIYEGLIPRIIKTFIKNPSKGYRKYQPEVERVTKTSLCTTCHGHRLNQQALSCLIAGKHLGDCLAMELGDLLLFLNQLTFPEAAEILTSITQQLQLLCQVGLGYLNLARETSTLSGGESQRIKLVRYIGSSLSDLLYILDEPSVGLHPYDIKAIRQLITAIKDNGNTILLIDHDDAIICLGDTIYELGPKAGKYGGQLVNVSTYPDWQKNQANQQQLIRDKQLADFRAPLTVTNLTINTLENISARLPQHCLIALTGVAGSGKSSFATGFLQQHREQTIYVDQKTIRGSRRSTIATYTGIFDEIRQLFSHASGLAVGYFSFNGKGACPVCKGKGFIETELAFLETTRSCCEACGGTKYNPEALQHSYQQKTIEQVLQLSIEEALAFFEAQPKITQQLIWLNKIGLDYLTLGQTLDTLSGGELQRLKLSLNLNHQQKVFILDEPTTGLSQQDVQKLLSIFSDLLVKGNTIIVIEHNMQVAALADWLIDFGPGSGRNGGQIIYQGLPAGVTQEKNSLTGQYLPELPLS